MAIDSRNEMVRSAQGVPVKGDPKRSFLSYPINCGRAEVGVVREYNAETGIATVNSIWDTAEPPKDFFVACVAQGKIGVPPPTEERMQPGSFLVYHRVGEFNSRGLNPSGANPLPELREESADKVSYYHFFFDVSAGGVAVPIPIIATGEILGTPVSGVKTTRSNPGGVPFVDTGLRQLLVFDVFNVAGNPYRVKSVGVKKILSLQTDSIPPDRGTLASCDDEVIENRVFVFNVVPGSLAGEDAFVFHSPATISVTPVFCGGGEAIAEESFPLPPPSEDFVRSFEFAKFFQGG